MRNFAMVIFATTAALVFALPAAAGTATGAVPSRDGQPLHAVTLPSRAAASGQTRVSNGRTLGVPAQVKSSKVTRVGQSFLPSRPAARPPVPQLAKAAPRPDVPSVAELTAVVAVDTPEGLVDPSEDLAETLPVTATRPPVPQPPTPSEPRTAAPELSPVTPLRPAVPEPPATPSPRPVVPGLVGGAGQSSRPAIPN